MMIFFIRKVRLLIMDQLMDILTEVNSDVDYSCGHSSREL